MADLPPPRVLAPPRALGPVRAVLGEGLCWSPATQRLWWVDILSKRLYCQSLDGAEPAAWTFADTVSAVAERRAGPGLALTLRRGLVLFDPETGAQRPCDEPEADRPGNRFNDGKCDAAGRFWGGTMDFDAAAPTGDLWRFDAAGRATRAAALGWRVTNGPTWTLDGRTILVNDTVARRVVAFDFDPDAGTLSAPRDWLVLPEADGHPDGMTTDAAGRVWIAHWGGACVTCHDPRTAAELLRIPLPTDHVTNVEFCGPALTTLVASSARVGLSPARLVAQPLAGALFAIELDTPGLAPHRFAG